MRMNAKHEVIAYKGHDRPHSTITSHDIQQSPSSYTNTYDAFGVSRSDVKNLRESLKRS
ncbi:hypothetical protein N781_10825 [Pontibacillus halophilus JSM 076056 = DSM 19796]|uniref:Uncharacterized protein n=1 Tax=Pontibacillus halophilus JSM 076056 = DSM 19796 TaxID=1385510 RepID=A0A0A5GQW9_9BACI|nr:hypothetical protein [Pontibacillus halophilus]KGX93633.1 hypothetical protein N781_10825 [Pontibacillus halophilus JSM 076056 = DSM 19796]